MADRFNSWLEIGGKRFCDAVRSIIDYEGKEVRRSISAKLGNPLGEEDPQCEHLFTAIFKGLQYNHKHLSQFIIEDSQIPNLLVEFRYYRSKRRRSMNDPRIQFVEKETGADFALALQVDLPGLAATQRHVLAQVKLVGGTTAPINREQLEVLSAAAGGELGLYSLWGGDLPPEVITIANLKAVLNASPGQPLVSVLHKFSRSLSHYVVDEFLGLWHGIDFHASDYPKKKTPKGSPPVLANLLHGPEPPPNTAYFGIYPASKVRVPPGFHVQGMQLPEGTWIDGEG